MTGTSGSTTVHAPDREGRGAKAPRPLGALGVPDVVKYMLLIVFDGLALWGLLRTIEQEAWIPFGVILVGALLVNVVYGTRRLIPGKYLLPGSIFLALFAVFPVIYTVYLSFTNYGTGHIQTKPEAIRQIESQVIVDPDAPRYRAEIFEGDEGYFMVLVDAQGNAFVAGENEGDPLQPVPPDQLEVSPSGRITSYDGQAPLNLGERNDLTQQDKDDLAITTPTGVITLSTLTEATIQAQRFVYDEAQDAMVETETGLVFPAVDGRFFNAENGVELDPGWTIGVGFENYRELFSNEAIRDSFIRVFVWTMFFSVATVAMQFGFGLLLAMIFNNERMKFRGVYRVLLIIPYALPTFMTILVWRGMLNKTFGIVNIMLGWINLGPYPWLTEASWARFSVLLVNLWLGFPYFFLVATGALQGIPKDLTEAAFVDGANGMKAFRRVTFPLLLIATAPVLISSFAFNFNNFNLIELLTAGGPDTPGQLAGATDIMITFTNTVAFGGAGADYGLATAISVMIFIVVATISALGFRLTRSFEEVR